MGRFFAAREESTRNQQMDNAPVMTPAEILLVEDNEA